jgi:hypothetical protein
VLTKHLFHACKAASRLLKPAPFLPVYGMITASDLFVGILTSATLSASGEEVQAAMVDDMVEQLAHDVDLCRQLERAQTRRRQAGDFGMEIAGAILVPVLMEAAKGLWAAYLKKLGEKAGGQLADLTFKQVAKLIHHLWAGEEQGHIQADFVELVKLAAGKQGMASEQIEALLVAIRSAEMQTALEAQAKV